METTALELYPVINKEPEILYPDRVTPEQEEDISDEKASIAFVKALVLAAMI